MTVRARTWELRFRLREWLDRSWIVIPSAYVVAALVLGKRVPALERTGAGPLGLELAPDSARDILQAVAGGMISFTGLVASVAVVVVQFGAGQYSPRLVLRFRRDPAVKHALGIFIAPALYALVTLGDVGGPDDERVPNLTVAGAVLLLVVAIIAFFLLIARLLDLLRPRRLYDQLRLGCERAIDQVYPRRLDAAAGAGPPLELPAAEPVVHRGANGVLSAVDMPRLVRAAATAGAVVELPVRVGEYVWNGEPLLLVHGGGAISERELTRAMIVAEERTFTQDPPFALRTIVDIALRALSPAVNDPTTAVQALDTLETLLHRFAGRDLGIGRLLDADGALRVVYPAADWHELLDLALTEIRSYGSSSHQIARRLRALLLGLLAGAPEVRRAAVRHQLALLDASVARSFPDGERELAAVADHTGLGGRTEPREG